MTWSFGKSDHSAGKYLQQQFIRTLALDAICERIVPLALGYERVILDALTVEEHKALDRLFGKLQHAVATL